jgi:hypothetical protein
LQNTARSPWLSSSPVRNLPARPSCKQHIPQTLQRQTNKMLLAAATSRHCTHSTRQFNANCAQHCSAATDDAVRVTALPGACFLSSRPAAALYNM